MDLMLLRADGGEVWVKPASIIMITQGRQGSMITLTSGDKILAEDSAETLIKKISDWGNF